MVKTLEDLPDPEGQKNLKGTLFQQLIKWAIWSNPTWKHYWVSFAGRSVMVAVWLPTNRCSGLNLKQFSSFQQSVGAIGTFVPTFDQDNHFEQVNNLNMLCSI
ncbi:MAG: hypothetical protein HQL69_22400 [Magnetococcales bacterium]|nr:hypothetical protein [Magnetococcales bacterium]